MSGLSKPNIPNLGEEASFTLIGGLGSSGTQPSGLFNGVSVNEWNTINVMYWNALTNYVEIDIYDDVNIWRAGTTDWANSKSPLNIKRYNQQSLTYDDVTALYPQTLTAVVENQWEKTIQKLPKGRYRFESTGLRIDSEWYLENVSPLSKTLILHDGEYKRWNNSVGSLDNVNAIPIMTSDVLPSGSVNQSSIQATNYGWNAFDKNTTSGWLTTGTSGWISYEFPSSKIIGKYTLKPPYNATSGISVQRSPKDWTFEGSNDGVTWIVLDTKVGVTDWVDNTLKEFNINNKVSYKIYRVNVTASNYSSGTAYLGFSEIEMFELINVSPPSWQTVSSTLPTVNQFVEKGMNSLTPLLDRKVTILEPQEMTLDSTPVGSGKVYRKKVDLNKYFDIKTISTETRNE